MQKTQACDIEPLNKTKDQRLTEVGIKVKLVAITYCLHTTYSLLLKPNAKKVIIDPILSIPGIFTTLYFIPYAIQQQSSNNLQ